MAKVKVRDMIRQHEPIPTCGSCDHPMWSHRPTQASHRQATACTVGECDCEYPTYGWEEYLEHSLTHDPMPEASDV